MGRRASDHLRVIMSLSTRLLGSVVVSARQPRRSGDSDGPLHLPQRSMRPQRRSGARKMPSSTGAGLAEALCCAYHAGLGLKTQLERSVGCSGFCANGCTRRASPGSQGCGTTRARGLRAVGTPPSATAAQRPPDRGSKPPNQGIRATLIGVDRSACVLPQAKRGGGVQCVGRQGALFAPKSSQTSRCFDRRPPPVFDRSSFFPSSTSTQGCFHFRAARISRNSDRARPPVR